MTATGRAGTEDLRENSSALSATSTVPKAPPQVLAQRTTPQAAQAPTQEPAAGSAEQLQKAIAPALVWLELRGFRSFGTQVRRLDLDAPLVVIHAGNSQGKTALAEAFEFLVTGSSSRKEMLGGASSEFHHSLRNVHLPIGDDDVYVAAGVRGPDGTVHEVRRQLTTDFAHGTSCQSRLTIDGVCVPDLAALGLAPSDSPLGAPVLLQHTLRHVLSTTPKDRVAYFKAVLDLTDLDRLRTTIADVRTRLTPAPRGPGLVAVDKLFGTPAASLITALQQMPVMLFDDEQAQAAVDEQLLRTAEQLTGISSATLPALVLDLAALAEEQQERTFALAPYSSAAAAPVVPDVVSTSAYTQALEESDREAARLIPIFTSVLESPAFTGLDTATDCPVCATPQALTPARLDVLREQVRRTETVEAAVTAVGRQLSAARTEAERLPAALNATIPRAASWTPEQVAIAGAALGELGVQRALLEDAVRAAAEVAAAVEGCQRPVTALVEVLREQQDAVRRRQDLPAGSAGAAKDLTVALGVLAEKRRLSHKAAQALTTAVTFVLTQRAGTSGLPQLREVLDHSACLVAELRDCAAHRHGVQRLERAEQALITSIGSVLDTRFARMSGAIVRWWLTVRPEELVSFDGVQRRASGATFINLIAALRTNAEAEPVLRDALGIYSDSQLNALGLATFLARAQLLGVPLLFLDDPIPGSDSDHRHTFAQHTLGELLSDGRQVILTTFDHKLSDLAAGLHEHLTPITYRLTLDSVVTGTEVTATSDLFSQYMAEGEDHVNARTPTGRRAACGSYRSAAERLAKQVIATARTHGGVPTSIADVEKEAPVLGKLVPLVRPHVDNAEKGVWASFAKVLNPGNHDDDVPSAADLRVARGNLFKLHKDHVKCWPGGLRR